MRRFLRGYRNYRDGPLVELLLEHRPRRELKLKQLAVERGIQLLPIELKIERRGVLPGDHHAADLELRRDLELDFSIWQVGRLRIGANSGVGDLRPRLEVLN